MKRLLILLGTAGLITITGCGDKVADPKVLYQQYLKDDTERQAKISECKLLSVDDQMKSQSCTIAFKADGDKQLKKRGFVDLKPVDLKTGKERENTK